MKVHPLIFRRRALGSSLSVIATSLLLSALFEIAQASGPRPYISQITPGTIAAGATGIRLIVSGRGFVLGSVLRWNGSNRPTTANVSAQLLIADIPASDIRTAGRVQITVLNPGGLSSDPVVFDVIKRDATTDESKAGLVPDFFIVPIPPPTLSSVGPAVVAQGARQVRVTLVGLNFKPGAKVVISPPLPEPSASKANQMAADIALDSVTRVSDKIIVVSGGIFSETILRRSWRMA